MLWKEILNKRFEKTLDELMRDIISSCDIDLLLKNLHYFGEFQYELIKLLKTLIPEVNYISIENGVVAKIEEIFGINVEPLYFKSESITVISKPFKELLVVIYRYTETVYDMISDEFDKMSETQHGEEYDDCDTDGIKENPFIEEAIEYKKNLMSVIHGGMFDDVLKYIRHKQNEKNN